MKKLLAILFLLFSLIVSAQTYVGRQLADQFPTTGVSSGLTYGLTWLPTNYNVSTETYPLIIFLHGAGEDGDGIAGLSQLISTALPKFIADGWNPTAVNPLTGETKQFIVVSPQAPESSNWSYSYTHVRWILANVKSRYRVDPHRVYITGLSAGGGGAWSCIASSDPAFTKGIAGVVTVSSVGVSAGGGVSSANLKYATKDHNVKAWTICGTADGGSWNLALTYANLCNELNPTPLTIRTGITGASHNSTAWNTTYDPNWRGNTYGLNMYEWMLQYSQAPPTAPTVSAGNDQSITLPTSEVSFFGTATPTSGRTITDYQWIKISGPTSYTFSNASSAINTASGLTQGTYVFELRATDSQGEIGADQVTVVVNPAGTPPVANAGPTRVIGLPINSVTLDGSGSSDADGVIVSYSWTREVGSNGTIASPSSSQTTVNGLTQQTYRYRLTVTDNSGSSAWDTVTVVVNAASPHTAPVVNPGWLTRSITAPQDSLKVWATPATYDGASISNINISKLTDPNYEPVLLIGLGSSTMQGTGASNVGRSVFTLWRTWAFNMGLSWGHFNLGRSGTNLGHAMPDGYHTLAGGSAPDTTMNISAAIRRANGHRAIYVINFPGNSYDVMHTDTIMKGYRVLVEIILANNGIPVITTTQVREQFSAANQQKMMTIRDSILNAFPDYSVDWFTGTAEPGSYVALSQYSAGDGIHRNDAGHRRFYEILKAHNPFRWFATSTASIETPTVAESFITGITQGVHKYMISINDDYGLAGDTILTVTANPAVGCAGQRRVIIPSSGMRFLSSSNFTYNPGDTIILSSQYNPWKQFSMTDIHGTPECPVVVINDGPVVFEGDGSVQNIGFGSCSYIKFTGTGSASTFFGFDISSTDKTGTAISINGKSKNITVDHVSIRKKRYGCWAKNEADCDATVNAWTLDSLFVHDWKVRDMGEQCLYWGSTNPSGGERDVTCNGVTSAPAPSRMDNLRIYNLDIDSTGRAAIQVSAGQDRETPGMSEIYNCVIRNTGLNLDNTQGGAVSMGGFTRVYIHDLDIKYGFIYGIWGVGASYMRVENNRIDSMGWHKGSQSELINYARPIMVQSSSSLNPPDSVQYIIKNNQVGIGSGIVPRINIIGSNLKKTPGQNIVCGNTNLNGTAANIEIAGTEVYSTNCGGGSNLPPSANAGSNKSITLPTASTSLTGGGTDSDGSISSYLWTKISGPAGGTISSPTSATTNITALQQGTYIFQLTVTDNGGATASALVTITVNPLVTRTYKTHLILKRLKNRNQ